MEADSNSYFKYDIESPVYSHNGNGHTTEASYRAIVFRSGAMQKVWEFVERAALYDDTVLLSGATGTGKELIAWALHKLSRRKDGVFQPVPCKFSKDTMRSDLFGHKRGAFTGADNNRDGYFRRACKGTIFLDDVSEIPIDEQASLLRVLQDGEIFPMGVDTPLKVDVRIIAASNKDLLSLVREGKFREDLYYRLNGCTVKMPLLRERADDIPPLVEFFAWRFGARNHCEGVIVPSHIVDMMKRKEWPGNVRELENFVNFFFTSADVALEYLSKAEDCAGEEIEMSKIRTLKQLDEEYDKQMKNIMIVLLKRHRGNVAQAAKEAGIERTTFIEKLRRVGISADQYRSIKSA